MKFQIISGTDGKFVLKGYYPYDIGINGILEVSVDGAIVSQYDASNGKISIELPISSGTHTIQINSASKIVATPPGTRTDLSYILIDYYFE